MTEKLQTLQIAIGTRYVIVDLEATCWEGPHTEPNEIIEIGAVAYEVGAGATDEFQTFVRPKLHPVLSDFCVGLTSIQQSDVDGALPFPQAYASFRRWLASNEPAILASWGDYDLNQIVHDCRLHGLDTSIDRHISLKSAFADMYHRKKCGMAGALRSLGITLEGTHHRGIDDARNIARILDWMLHHPKESL